MGVLLTLDPTLVKEVDLGASYKVIRQLISGNQEVKNLLSAGGDLEAVAANTLAAAAVNELLGENLSREVRSARVDGSEDQHLILAEIDAAKGKPAVTADGSQVATLGWTDIVSGWIGRVQPDEAVRKALKDWLGKDTTFDLTTEDKTFKDIMARVGPGVDYVITGHTHLARSIDFAPGRRYFNCGTWIRLVRLTEEVLDDPQLFNEHVYQVFEKRTMDAVDEARIPGRNGQSVPLVLDRTDTVKISRDGAQVTAELLRVFDIDNGKNVDFKDETGGIDE